MADCFSPGQECKKQVEKKARRSTRYKIREINFIRAILRPSGRIDWILKNMNIIFGTIVK